MKFEESRVRNALRASWSLQTAQQWSVENPANGQCNVTAVVVHDLFGGKILRTQLPGVWHYYNEIDGQRLDLSDSQFTDPNARFDPPNDYDDAPTNREEALSCVLESEYDALRSGLVAELSKRTGGEDET